MDKQKITIAGNDISKYRIVYSKKAHPSEIRSAGELKSYLEKSTGLSLPLIDDSCAPNEYEIIVGKTDRAEDELIDRGDMADEGFDILVKNKKLIIAGAQRRGTMYGVYEFLEKFIGWRFFTPEQEEHHGEKTVSLDEGFTYHKIPVMEYRELDWVCARDRDFCVKQKVNGSYRSFPPEYGENLNWGGGAHTISNFLPVSDSAKEQPCITDPDNIKRVIELLGKELEKNPNLDIYEISQNDNQNYCKCDRCRQIDEEQESHSGSMIYFINALSDAFREKYPRLNFQTFAYQYTRKPPKTLRPRDNIIIKLCPMERCCSHALEDEGCPDNKAFRDDLQGWNEICNKVYIWDYVTNYAYFIAPFPNFETLRQNVHFFAANSVKGLYPEGNYIAPSGEFGELRAYLLAKIMWDPYMSKEEYYTHMHEFMEAYYGAGWREILKFIDFTTQENLKVHCDLWSHPSLVVPFDKYEERLYEIDGWWNAAEAAVKDDPLRLSRVKRSRLQFTIIKLTLEHKTRYLGGDDNSKIKYCFDNQAFYNTLVLENVGWREAYMFPYRVDFTKPPLDWCMAHTYGEPPSAEFDN